MRILRDVDYPIADIIAADGPGQRDAARYRPDAQRISTNFAVGHVLLPN